MLGSAPVALVRLSSRRLMPACLLACAGLLSARVALADEPTDTEDLADLSSSSVGSLLGVPPGTPWHLQLQGRLQEKAWAKVYDIDLYDTPASTIQSLASRGKVVHCYFSAGSAENWRSDYSKFPSAGLGKNMDGWPGEKWVDVRSAGVRAVLLARMDLAKSKGCAGIDPDNVDGYAHPTGFPLKQSDSIEFIKWLAAEGHKRGLTVGLKNGLEILAQVGAAVDWAINEQCVEYSECSAYRSFLAAGKPVFHVEYSGTLSKICSKTKPLNISTVKAPLALNGPAEKCP